MTHRGVDVHDNRYDQNDLDDLYKFSYHGGMPPHTEQHGNRQARAVAGSVATQQAEPQPATNPGPGHAGPHPAQVYAYWLGSKDYYKTDREAAEAVIGHRPEVVARARANRAFGRRVSWYAAYGCGIRQFLDIGSGLPAPGATHEVAQQADRNCRVVYADNEPLVLARARALLTPRRRGTVRVHQRRCPRPRGPARQGRRGPGFQSASRGATAGHPAFPGRRR